MKTKDFFRMEYAQILIYIVFLGLLEVLLFISVSYTHLDVYKRQNQCNVEDQKLKEARVKIVILAKQVIKDGLDLLGIQCPEQM